MYNYVCIHAITVYMYGMFVYMRIIIMHMYYSGWCARLVLCMRKYMYMYMYMPTTTKSCNGETQRR